MCGCRKYQHVSGKISVFGVRSVYMVEKGGGGRAETASHALHAQSHQVPACNW